MKKLNEILLIDDDEITNFTNKSLIEDLDIAHGVQVLEDGEEAFDYLVECSESLQKTCPEFVIFDHQCSIWMEKN